MVGDPVDRIASKSMWGAPAGRITITSHMLDAPATSAQDELFPEISGEQCLLCSM